MTFLEKMLKLPPVEWGAFCDKTLKAFDKNPLAPGVFAPSAIAQDLDDKALFKVQRLALISAYVNARFGGDGCGRKEHAYAVTVAMKQLVKIRKALGYSYPDRGVFSF
jgi:hypothetical protein